MQASSTRRQALAAALGLLPLLARAQPRRIFVPFGTPGPAAAELRATGWLTVAGLVAVADPASEARRIDCGYLLTESGPVKA